MLLHRLLKPFCHTLPSINPEITHLSLDSRQISKHGLFIAIPGHLSDGRNFIEQASAQGAAAILYEREVASAQEINGVAHIGLPQLRLKLADIAANFYQHPANKLALFGVTGTNGKTSITHFIAQSLAALGEKCGVVGTLGCGFIGELQETGLTTPDALKLQEILQQFVVQQAKSVAMEVSSHAIALQRVNSLQFETAIFTNLTQDHLDYHGTMAAYAAVKKKFLQEWPHKHLVINADDNYGSSWLPELAAHPALITYSLKKPTAASIPGSLIYAEDIKRSWQSICAQVVSPWGCGTLQLNAIGDFNLSNALATLAALCLHNISFAQALQCCNSLQAVPGRMQFLGGNGKPWVVVDYSHTPDALEKALLALRAQTKGKLICIFGCGGDRDPHKRPLMAKVAEQLADQVIVTNDNPRNEDPKKIAHDILAGFAQTNTIQVQLNRMLAIAQGIQCATAEDCVLIAGKGAEHYQQIGQQKFPFSDVQIAQEFLAKVSANTIEETR